MKSDFSAMTQKEHREYVLQNRNDDEAIRAFFARPDLKWVTMPPMFEDGKPIEENIKLAEDIFRKRLERRDPSKE